MQARVQDEMGAKLGNSTNVQDKYDNINVKKNTTAATIHHGRAPGYNRMDAIGQYFEVKSPKRTVNNYGLPACRCHAW